MGIQAAWSRGNPRGRRAAAALLFAVGVMLVCAARSAAAPFVQQGPKLVAAGEVGAAEWGSWLAVSDDGSTALIGASQDNNFEGAVWPYVRSGSSWVPQGPKLTPSDGVAQPDFGDSVALSSDGNSAIIGGSFDDGGAGAVWFFSRSGSTWTQDGPKVTESGSQAFGQHVAISGDGDEAMVESPQNASTPGAILIYGRSGSTWALQSTISTPDAGLYPNFGFAMALSRDGNTAAITAGFGSVYVYTRSGSTWTQAALLAAPSDGAGVVTFGGGLAVSADGSTILVSGAQASLTSGDVWAYVRSGTQWVQQGPGLAADDGLISLSDDGNTALIGTTPNAGLQGAALVYTRSASVWTEQPPIPVPSDAVGSESGFALTLSGDGSTAIIGAPDDNSDVGAAWVFATAIAPAVTESPASVTVTVPATASFSVTCSGDPAPAIQWQVSTDGGTTWSDDTADAGATTATLTVSASAAGTAEYRAVCSNLAGSATSAAATLTAVAPPPPAVVVSGVFPHQGSAFSIVVISGTGFRGAREVDFGAGHKALFLPLTNSLILALAPSHAAGTVDVTVRTPRGTSATSSTDRFTYIG